MKLVVWLLVMWLQMGPVVYLPLVAFGEAEPPATPTPTASATWTPTPTVTPTWTPTPTTTMAPAMLRIGMLQCETANEYVRVDNMGGTAVNLAGWRILSVVGSQTFFFPNYQLEPGASIYVHSGPNAPPSGGNRLRWTTAYVWNNNNDEARLITPGGIVISSRTC